ncbi:hypothetical protein [Achromobacter aloeverae]
MPGIGNSSFNGGASRGAALAPALAAGEGRLAGFNGLEREWDDHDDALHDIHLGEHAANAEDGPAPRFATRPSRARIGDERYADSADPELRAALASGDVFEVVYAIMKVMYGAAAENVRRRGYAVREKNLEQERIRSAQQRIRDLANGFKPGAKVDDKLKDTTGYSEEKAKAATRELQALGWDLGPYEGAVAGGTQKQQLDDLITSMDSKLTSYNNMNSIETNDLAREGQAAQAYLTGMTSILSKENQTLSGIATSLGR